MDVKKGEGKFIMNLFKKFRPDKWKLVEFYCKSLSDISKLGGIYNYQFTKAGIVYSPSVWMLNFFITVLGKISNLGFNDRQITKELNSYNIHNLLYTTVEQWNADDVSLFLKYPLT